MFNPCKVLYSLCVILLVSACAKQENAAQTEKFIAPEFSNMDIKVGETTATICCNLSRTNDEFTYGFLYGEQWEQLTETTVTPEGSQITISFSCVPTGLGSARITESLEKNFIDIPDDYFNLWCCVESDIEAAKRHDNSNEMSNEGNMKYTMDVTWLTPGVDLGLSVLWRDCNLGAENPEQAGDHFEWHGVENDPAKKILGKGWRTPTSEEFRELEDNCTIEDSETGRLLLSAISRRQMRHPTSNEQIAKKNQFGLDTDS